MKSAAPRRKNVAESTPSWARNRPDSLGGKGEAESREHEAAPIQRSARTRQTIGSTGVLGIDPLHTDDRVKSGS